MENYCKYRPIKYLDSKDIDNRLKHLYKGMCYLLGNSGGGGIQSIVAGTNISVDDTDPQNPIVSASSYDSTVDFSVNANPNTVGTTFSPNTPNLTTVIYVSTIDGSQWTSNGTTYTLYVAPYWAKTGNSGINPSIHFIGPTNNVDLNFRTNNIARGNFLSTGSFTTVLDAYFNQVRVGKGNNSLNNNQCVGGGALNAITTGDSNHAFGVFALGTCTTGQRCNAFGYRSLNSNLIGNDCVAFGYSSLFQTTGSGNLGLGNYSGYYNTTVANQIFINNIDRGNYTGDQNDSPIYIQQNATVANQKVFLNGLMNLSYVPTYADNTAALGGGLVAGNIYKINNSGTYTLAIVV